jgi:hypothetical protein
MKAGTEIAVNEKKIPAGVAPVQRRPELTAERLREVLDYDVETGEFRWKPRPEKVGGGWHRKIFNQRYAGKRAGCPDAYGYIQITVDGRNYKAHRLAWLLVHGVLPADQSIDHRDGDPASNAISNLRLANPAQQMANQRRRKTAKPGAKGCYWSPRDKRWAAAIWQNGKRIPLGYHRELEDAKAAYAKAAAEIYASLPTWERSGEPLAAPFRPEPGHQPSTI